MLKTRNSYDLSIGGFGPFFIEIFTFSTIVMVNAAKKAGYKAYKDFLFPGLTLLFISLIMPENWWSRYIPFFWYFPCFLIIMSKYGMNKTYIYILILLFIINNINFIICNTINGKLYTENLNNFISEVKNNSNDTINIVLDADFFEYSINEKIKYNNVEKKIRYTSENNNKINNKIPLSHIAGWY
jgi:hypothetical protein